MKYEHTMVLKRWALLQLAVASARSVRELGRAPGPADGVIVDSELVTKSKGFRALRAWFVGLSPGGKDRAIRWMTTHLDGVAKLEAKLKAEGSDLDYADLNDVEFSLHAAPPAAATSEDA